MTASSTDLRRTPRGIAALVAGVAVVPSLALAGPTAFAADAPSAPASASSTSPTSSASASSSGPAKAAAAPLAASAKAALARGTSSAMGALTHPWRWRNYMSQQISWSPKNCSAEVKQIVDQVGWQAPGMAVECASLYAALNWRDPSQGNIKLQITRSRRIVKAGDSRPTRQLFVNPGGPGVAADFMAPAVTFLEPKVAAQDDVIAVDPRGTGGSTPLACTIYSDGVVDYRLRRSADVDASNAALKKTVSGCAAKNARYLRQINTYNTVQDLNMVREYLGAAKADYLGVSAGTWLGSRWAQMFPGTVGRFVLDSNLQFTADWRQAFGWQPKGFQRRFDRMFLPWVARNNETYRLGSGVKTVRAKYEAVRKAAGAGKLGMLTPNQLDNMIAAAMYSDDQFSDLAPQLSAWYAASQKSTTVTPPPGPRSRTSAEDTVFMAVPCNDSAWTKNLNSYVREGRLQGSQFPLIGNSWTTQACGHWPYGPVATPTPTGKGVPNVLMVQTELDAATPLEGASLADKASSNTARLTVDNQGNHGAYLSNNSCVENAVGAFLVEGKMPAAGTVCGGIPLPGDTQVYPVNAGLNALRPRPATAWAPRMTPEADALRKKLHQVAAQALVRNR